MSTSVAAVVAVTVVVGAVLTGCTSTQRTGTNFCKRLAESLPEIGEPVETQGEVLEQVSRYERLLEVAPLSIEEDLAVLTALIRRAAEVDPNDPAQLQALADESYAAKSSAEAVAAWTISTCAVDISTGMRVDPPRQPVATTTTAPAPAPETSVTPPTEPSTQP